MRNRIVGLAGLLVVFAVTFNLYHLYPEVAVKAPVIEVSEPNSPYLAEGRQ